MKELVVVVVVVVVGATAIANVELFKFATLLFKFIIELLLLCCAKFVDVMVLVVVVVIGVVVVVVVVAAPPIPKTGVVVDTSELVANNEAPFVNCD